MFIHLLVLSSIVRFTSVYGRHNITVDDPDPAIIYAPANSWILSANNSLNVGGAHMLTQDKTATATFTFTGVFLWMLTTEMNSCCRTRRGYLLHVTEVALPGQHCYLPGLRTTLSCRSR